MIDSELEATYQTEDGRDMFIVMVATGAYDGIAPLYNGYGFCRRGVTWFEARGIHRDWLTKAFGGYHGMYLIEPHGCVRLQESKLAETVTSVVERNIETCWAVAYSDGVNF